MKKLLFWMPLFLSGFLFCEEITFNAGFDFKAGLSFPDGNFSAFGKAETPFVEVFAGLKTQLSSVPKDATVFSQKSFEVNCFGLCFSPVLYLDKKKPQKCLSLYFGKLNYSSTFGKLKGNSFSKPRYGSNVTTAKNGSFGLSAAGQASDFGVAFVLPYFELDYVASKNEKSGGFDHAVFCAFNGKGTTALNGLYVSAYAGVSASVLGAKKYNVVFGSSFVFKNEYIGVQGDFATSVNTDKACGFSGSFKAQNFYEHCNIKIGVSANSKKFIAWKNTFAANTLSFFASPEISFGIFTLGIYYNLERTGLLRSEKYARGVEELEQTAGGKIELENRHFKFVSSLDYAKNVFSLELKNALYFPQVAWFKKLEAKFNCSLISKNVNRYVVQKYACVITSDFVPVKNISLTGNFLLSQQNTSKKLKQEGQMIQVIEWQPLVVEGGVTLKYALEGKYAKNTFSLKVKGLTVAPHYGISLEYSVRF
jgi:hypothetical protein